MTQYERELSNLSYTNKDFNSIYTELLDLAKKISYKWDPTTSDESDPGVVLLKLMALIGDKNNYNIDKNILETYPLSVTQDTNARQLFEQLGYTMSYYQSATTYVSLTWIKDPDLTGQDLSHLTDSNIDDDTVETILNTSYNKRIYHIPRFTQVTDADKSHVFTLIEDATVTSDGITVSVEALEGTHHEYEINGETTITAANLDYRNRIYFLETDIAENGIFISNVGKDNYKEWIPVDNLVLQPLETTCYKFGLDEIGRCYVEFPSDIDNLIGEGITITYVRTHGRAGNISRNRLSQFFTELNAELTIEFPMYPSNKSMTKELTNENVFIVNREAAVDGRDPESIDDAYRNYQKVKNTFDTLVSLKDYADFLYSREYVSNGFVCDRTNDIQSTYKVLESDNNIETTHTYINTHEAEITGKVKGSDTLSTILVEEPEMTAFDLRIYALQFVEGDATTEGFQTSFKVVVNNVDIGNNAVETSNRLEQVKATQHDLKTFELNRILMIKNKYPIITKIIPQYKLTTLQTQDVIQKIAAELHIRLNARKLNFGEALPYNDIYDTILNADPRIKAISLEEFVDFQTYAQYFDGHSIQELRIDHLSEDPTNAHYVRPLTDIEVAMYNSNPFTVIPKNIGVQDDSSNLITVDGIHYRSITDDDCVLVGHSYKLKTHVQYYEIGSAMDRLVQTLDETPVPDKLYYIAHRSGSKKSYDGISYYECSDSDFVFDNEGKPQFKQYENYYELMNLSTLWNDFRTDIHAKSVLAGVTPLFLDANKFSHSIEQANAILSPEYSRLNTDTKIILKRIPRGLENTLSGSGTEQDPYLVLYAGEYICIPEDNESNMYFTYTSDRNAKLKCTCPEGLHFESVILNRSGVRTPVILDTDDVIEIDLLVNDIVTFIVTCLKDYILADHDYSNGSEIYHDFVSDRNGQTLHVEDTVEVYHSSRDLTLDDGSVAYNDSRQVSTLMFDNNSMSLRTTEYTISCTEDGNVSITDKSNPDSKLYSQVYYSDDETLVTTSIRDNDKWSMGDISEDLSCGSKSILISRLSDKSPLPSYIVTIDDAPENNVEDRRQKHIDQRLVETLDERTDGWIFFDSRKRAIYKQGTSLTYYPKARSGVHDNVKYTRRSDYKYDEYKSSYYLEFGTALDYCRLYLDPSCILSEVRFHKNQASTSYSEDLELMFAPQLQPTTSQLPDFDALIHEGIFTCTDSSMTLEYTDEGLNAYGELQKDGFAAGTTELQSFQAPEQLRGIRYDTRYTCDGAQDGLRKVGDDIHLNEDFPFDLTDSIVYVDFDYCTVAAADGTSISLYKPVKVVCEMYFTDSDGVDHRDRYTWLEADINYETPSPVDKLFDNCLACSGRVMSPVAENSETPPANRRQVEFTLYHGQNWGQSSYKNHTFIEIHADNYRIYPVPDHTAFKFHIPHLLYDKSMIPPISIEYTEGTLFDSISNIRIRIDNDNYSRFTIEDFGPAVKCPALDGKSYRSLRSHAYSTIDYVYPPVCCKNTENILAHLYGKNIHGLFYNNDTTIKSTLYQESDTYTFLELSVRQMDGDIELPILEISHNELPYVYNSSVPSDGVLSSFMSFSDIGTLDRPRIPRILDSGDVQHVIGTFDFNKNDYVIIDPKSCPILLEYEGDESLTIKKRTSTGTHTHTYHEPVCYSDFTLLQLVTNNRENCIKLSSWEQIYPQTFKALTNGVYTFSNHDGIASAIVFAVHRDSVRYTIPPNSSIRIALLAGDSVTAQYPDRTPIAFDSGIVTLDNIEPRKFIHKFDSRFIYGREMLSQASVHNLTNNQRYTLHLTYTDDSNAVTMVIPSMYTVTCTLNDSIIPVVLSTWKTELYYGSDTYKEWLRPNENVVFTAPNLIKDQDYSSYVKYVHNIHESSRPGAGDIVVPKDANYTLSDDEFICFFWKAKETDTYYTYYKYCQDSSVPDPIVNITPNFPLQWQPDGNRERFMELDTLRERIKKWPYGKGFVPEETIRGTLKVDGKDDYYTTTIRVNEFITQLAGSDYVLTGSNTITTKKVNRVHINSTNGGTSNIYWILNNVTDKQTFQLNFENNQYLLKTGEYLIYTNATKTQLIILGSGTLIQREIIGAAQDSVWEVDAVSYDDFINYGVDALADLWFTIPSQYNVFATEMEINQVGPDNAIYLQEFVKDLTDIEYNACVIDASGAHYASVTENHVEMSDKVFPLHEVMISFAPSNDQTDRTMLPLRNNESDSYRAYSMLNLRLARSILQPLYSFQSVSGIDMADTPSNFAATSCYYRNIIQGYLLADRELDVTGGTGVDVTTLVGVTNNNIKGLSLLYFEPQEDSDGLDHNGLDTIVKATDESTNYDFNHSIRCRLPQGKYIVTYVTSQALDSQSPFIRITSTELPDPLFYSSTDMQGKNVNSAGNHYILVDVPQSTSASALTELTITLQGSFKEPHDTIVIKPWFKYTDSLHDVYGHLYTETEWTSKHPELFDTIFTRCKELDYNNLFIYSYQVPDERLINNPLEGKAFLDSNHIFNPFTICEWNITPKTSDTQSAITILNNIR